MSEIYGPQEATYGDVQSQWDQAVEGDCSGAPDAEVDAAAKAYAVTAQAKVRADHRRWALAERQADREAGS
jgi:hypothetical protein